MHPNYRNLDYDYALVRVSTPFPLGQPGVQAVKLATVEPQPSTVTTVTGWGALSVSFFH